MKETIQKEDINKLNFYGKIYTILFILVIVSSVPLFIWLGTWAYVPWGIVFFIAMYFALKIEKIKKINDIQTYKEIVTFSKGIQLDEMEKQREIAKRPYEKFFVVTASAVIVVVICSLVGIAIHVFVGE